MYIKSYTTGFLIFYISVLSIWSFIEVKYVNDLFKIKFTGFFFYI